jgi:hypothetical protein
MILRALISVVLLIQLPMLDAQTKSAYPPVVVLPRAAVSRIPSPNGKWALIFECPNYSSARRLSIEDSASHTRRLVGEYERSLSISWAPDSHLFFVNDAYASNEALSYIYDPITLRATDLAKLLVADDPGAAQFLGVGHSYLHARRWLNSQELLVVLYGHFDEPPPRGFTLKYRVALNGRVRKISQVADERPE